MAKKKTAKKKARRRSVPAISEIADPISNEVVEEAPDDEVPTPSPAIQEEATLKVMDGGQATWYTETEYRAKYGKGK